jgi:predicted Zn-dependent protease with MMP-like domain
MIHVTRQEFEAIVSAALDELPRPLLAQLRNIEIEARFSPSKDDLDYAEAPDGEMLMGLYQGIPLTERDTHYDMVMPDLITIFQRPHEEACNTLEDLHAEVARTVRHEIAHHFGISDERLDELGAY